MKKFCSVLPLLSLGPCAYCASIFGFEGASEGSATEWSEISDGIEADFSQGGDSFWITEMPSSRPAGWGDRQLLTSSSEKPVVVDFSEFVNNVRVYGTDFGADQDVAFLEAWSDTGATGTLLGETSLVWGASQETPGFFELLLDVQNVKSIRFWSESEFGDNSLYWDNVTVNAAPPVSEPSTMVSLVLGGFGLVRRGRRKSKPSKNCQAVETVH